MMQRQSKIENKSTRARRISKNVDAEVREWKETAEIC